MTTIYSDILPRVLVLRSGPDWDISVIDVSSIQVQGFEETPEDSGNYQCHSSEGGEGLSIGSYVHVVKYNSTARLSLIITDIQTGGEHPLTLKLRNPFRQ